MPSIFIWGKRCCRRPDCYQNRQLKLKRLLFVLCRNELSIEGNRRDRNHDQKQAAAKKLSNPLKKLLPLNIGWCILLPLNKIYKSREVIVTDRKPRIF